MNDERHMQTHFVQTNLPEHNLDAELKSYFSQKEDVPPEVRIALHVKLRTAQTNDKLPWAWVIAHCMIVAAILIIGIVDMFFGRAAAVILGVVYYGITLMGGAAVVAALLVCKETATSHVSYRVLS